MNKVTAKIIATNSVGKVKVIRYLSGYRTEFLLKQAIETCKQELEPYTCAVEIFGLADGGAFTV
jgi:hypothetical protein